MNDHGTVSRRFWTDRTEYPNYDHVDQRRQQDILNIVTSIASHLGETRRLSFCDIGCGTGDIVRSMYARYDIDRCYASDLNPSWMEALGKAGYENGEFQIEDVTARRTSYPATDVFISNGLFIYVFDDGEAIDVLERIRARLSLIRLPCSLTADDIVINKKSEQLNEQYSALYRKPSSFLSLAEKAGLRLAEVRRAWPDGIESKFGTRQYLFAFRGERA
jgi:hypothetical protein